jgi:hypothetical protein
MTVIPFPARLELSSAAPPAIATDALADLVFSELLSREDELRRQLRLRPMRGFRGKKSRSWPVSARCFD